MKAIYEFYGDCGSMKKMNKTWLLANYKDMELVEGSRLNIDSKWVIVEHVTLSGFLYYKQPTNGDEAAVIVDGKTHYFYNSWEHLVFIECDVTAMVE